MTAFASLIRVRFVLLVSFVFAMLSTACGGDDAPEDAWVSVLMSSTAAVRPFSSDSRVLPDMRSRGIEPREITCGVVKNNYTGPSGLGEPSPDRIYHFRVSLLEATTLVATGRYVPRESYDETQPYTGIPCFQFALVPR